MNLPHYQPQAVLMSAFVQQICERNTSLVPYKALARDGNTFQQSKMNFGSLRGHVISSVGIFLSPKTCSDFRAESLVIRKLQGSKITFSKISARKKASENSRCPFQGKNPLKMGNYTIFQIFENPRRGTARNFTTNVPKILDLKSSSEQIFSKN